MKRFAWIKVCFLLAFAAQLMLARGLYASDLPAPDRDHHPEQAGVQKNVSNKALYIDMSPQLVLTTFLFYWIAKAFTLISATSIHYQNCQAFFVNPSSFNSYYTHLSALAP